MNDFIRLFFPKVCANCNNCLNNQEEILCTVCNNSLPVTFFHNQKDNPVEEIFWGRIAINFATSYLFMKKNNITAKLVHLFKYQNRPDIARYLSNKFSLTIKDKIKEHNIDFLIPVPLHPKKQAIRGYNQSEIIAMEMEEILNIKLENKLVKRIVNTSTQTKKHRYERWKNVESIFEINRSKNLSKFKNKHFLIIDDILTTGATIEALAQILIKHFNSKISVATLGIAS